MPFELKYLLYPSQLAQLKQRSDIDDFKEHLFPDQFKSKSKDSSTIEWCYVEAPRLNAERVKKEEEQQPAKEITASCFNVNQYIEVRGRCRTTGEIRMQEFTDFGDEYGMCIFYVDLVGHNHNLEVIINTMQRLYY